MGAVAGFLWWNAAPARIFMGDTGSLALGGLIGALAITTNTQLLLIVLGGLFVLRDELRHRAWCLVPPVPARRVFRMAPIHHHFRARRVARVHRDRPAGGSSRLSPSRSASALLNSDFFLARGGVR
jgi:phospho-N-acetylmuramoyl-pentapeptide-transferase